MNKSVSLREFVGGVRKRAVLSGLVLGLVLAHVWSPGVGFGFMAGAAVSVLNFQLMAVDSFEILEKTPGKARKFIVGRYFLRFAIMFGFLALIATRTDWNIMAAFAGVFFVPAILFFGNVFQAIHSRDLGL